MKRLVQCQERVGEPLDDIKRIFDKIQKWKQKAGDLDKQEKMVSHKLKYHERIKLHNMKTVIYKLDELKNEIDLTDDEISIIAYTSIDREWMTNLIIL